MNDEIVVYQPDEVTRIEPRFDGETVWLTQKEIAALFGRNVKTINRHLKEAEKEELEGLSTISNFEIVAADDKTRTVKCHNLDAVLSVGYRVKSPRGIQFRQWASKVLKERIMRQAQQNALQGRLEALERKMEGLAALPAQYVPIAETPEFQRLVSKHNKAAHVIMDMNGQITDIDTRVKILEDRENRPFRDQYRRSYVRYCMPPEKEFALEVLQDGGVWTIGRASQHFNKCKSTIWRWIRILDWTVKDNIIKPPHKEPSEGVVF